MFRELVRKNKQLSNEDCIELLEIETRGVLSVIGDGGYPYGMPMNHFYDRRDGCIYFHCGKGGHRLDALKACDKASFCVYNKGDAADGDWALTVKSVIVFGRVEVIQDMQRIVDITTGLCYKFTSDEQYINKELRDHAHKTLLLKLTPQHICGKLVTEA